MNKDGRAVHVYCDALSATSLLFFCMEAEEGLGKLFSYRLHLLSEDRQIDLQNLLGTPMAVQWQITDEDVRWFHGIVTHSKPIEDKVHKGEYAAYEVVLRPKPWLLTCKRECRIYTQMNVLDIVQSVLHDIGYSDVTLSNNMATYPPREYCVQYRESSFDFISRLLEQEGIYYFFEHTRDTHTMMLTDNLSMHAKAAKHGELSYKNTCSGQPFIAYWQPQHAVHTTSYSLTDYDPMNPRAALQVQQEAGSAADTKTLTGIAAFDFPGAYAATEEGQRYARIRAEAECAQHARYQGETRAAMDLAVGCLFTLKDAPRPEWNQDYVLTKATTTLKEAPYVSIEAAALDQEPPFSCTFEALAKDVPFRSPLTTQKPLIAGLQTAVVAGDREGEIAVDAYGRIRVIFHWIQAGAGAATSCPVRVATPWAGTHWGAVHIPRVGQEVVVSFLEGDPDRPLVIGSVFNATHMPSYALPENKTQSGFKSRTVSADAQEGNEIRFEDKQGAEELFLQAQRDMRVEVKNDQALRVKHDRNEQIDNDHTLHVGHNSQLETGQRFSLTAGTEIELVTGQASLVMKSSGEIELKGTHLTLHADMAAKLEGQVSVQIHAGATMDIGADATLKLQAEGPLTLESEAVSMLKGSTLLLQGEAVTQIEGAIIYIG